ncbi:hypothetical protein TNCV_4861661 [Trichonephila clavipes]|nr:hypothetical protein TNCV_4861661 [Trichonephila clavipes]
MQVTVRFGSVPPQFRGRTLWGWSEKSRTSLSLPPTTREDLRLDGYFRVPICRIQTAMSSPGFEPSPYCTAVSIANHYTGWATAQLHNYKKYRK